MKRLWITMITAMIIIATPLTALAANGDIMEYDGKDINGEFTTEASTVMFTLYTTNGFLDDGGKITISTKDGAKYKIGADSVDTIKKKNDTSLTYGGKAYIKEYNLDATVVYATTPNGSTSWNIKSPMDKGLNEFLAADFNVPANWDTQNEVVITDASSLLSWFINAKASDMTAEDLVEAAKIETKTEGAALPIKMEESKENSTDGAAPATRQDDTAATENTRNSKTEETKETKEQAEVEFQGQMPAEPEKTDPVTLITGVAATAGAIAGGFIYFKNKKNKEKTEEVRRETHIKEANENLKKKTEADLIEAVAEWDKEFDQIEGENIPLPASTQTFDDVLVEKVAEVKAMLQENTPTETPAEAEEKPAETEMRDDVTEDAPVQQAVPVEDAITAQKTILQQQEALLQQVAALSQIVASKESATQETPSHTKTTPAPEAAPQPVVKKDLEKDDSKNLAKQIKKRPVPKFVRNSGVLISKRDTDQGNGGAPVGPGRVPKYAN